MSLPTELFGIMDAERERKEKQSNGSMTWVSSAKEFFWALLSTISRYGKKRVGVSLFRYLCGHMKI